MENNPIIREPTTEERRDFQPIVDPGKYKKTVRELFDDKLNEEMQKAIKKGLPFCDRAARDDFNDGYNDQAKASLRKNGFVDASEIKPVKIDWSKYSDLKNFELIDEGEVADEYLTKHNPGLSVTFHKKVYKFKGYSNKYIVMEDQASAIRRARQKLKEE